MKSEKEKLNGVNGETELGLPVKTKGLDRLAVILIVGGVFANLLLSLLIFVRIG